MITVVFKITVGNTNVINEVIQIQVLKITMNLTTLFSNWVNLLSINWRIFQSVCRDGDENEGDNCCFDIVMWMPGWWKDLLSATHPASDQRVSEVCNVVSKREGSNIHKKVDSYYLKTPIEFFRTHIGKKKKSKGLKVTINFGFWWFFWTSLTWSWWLSPLMKMLGVWSG